MKVGIIGGGMMGLSTALYLSQQGIDVTVIEKEPEIGGLSRPKEILPGIVWDRYYHAILSTDSQVIDLLETIGISSEIVFTETNTGFYTDGQLHSMSSSLEFLKFKPLNLWHKFRLAMGILYASRIDSKKHFERTHARDWLMGVFGRRNTEKIWDPLLRSKFGSERHHASAALIWATIKRYYGTRKGSAKKELMGYVPGGYNTILRAIEKKIEYYSGRVVKKSSVVKVVTQSNGQIRIEFKDGSAMAFDRVIATIPNQEFIALCPQIPTAFRAKLESIRYLGLVCLTLLLKRPLSPFYVTNLTDTGFPFTGVIETTNHIARSEVGGNTLVYLPKYLMKEDDFFTTDNERVFEIFFAALQRIFPDLTADEVLTWIVNRERYVQPLLDINYSKRVVPMKTPITNLFFVNTTMILNSNLNNNQVLVLARQMADLLIGKTE